ncbi:hypothetical protein SAMN06264849_10846 [Melghirimyces algeriensis]|uniref:Uncharacterized protein n=1 Tax=Melghirimyces algeriensis TaxID=910412 RepID=A0A521E773_9BACL|nr:hypothetical protein SAMN06264849_10846 [Melghirimyces algeriensis]
MKRKLFTALVVGALMVTGVSNAYAAASAAVTHLGK